MRVLSNSILLMIALALSTSAFAKRDKRRGFNFGVGLRLIDQLDSKLSSNESDRKSNEASELQSVSPHVGFVVGDYFNVGLSGLFEDQSSQETITSEEENYRIESSSNSNLNAGSLFIRFLFASYMYFEAGVGLYDQHNTVLNTYTSNNESGFEGHQEKYSFHGTGPGYHLGAGLEIAVTNGFFFTSNFIARSFQLWEKTGDSLGKKKAKVEKRELTFGLSHYVD